MEPETKKDLMSIVQTCLDGKKEQARNRDLSETLLGNLIDTLTAHKGIFEEILGPVLPKGKLKYVVTSKNFKPTQLQVFVKTSWYKPDILVIGLFLDKGVPRLSGVPVHNNENLLKIFVKAVLVGLELPKVPFLSL